MINKKFFSKLQKEYTGYTSNRRQIIRASDDILKSSKAAIFACHREEYKTAKENLESAEKTLKSLKGKAEREGSYLAALEEYAEAKLFYNFLQNGKVDEIKNVALSFDTYIGALSDFTGELTRRVVALATKRRIKEVEEIKKVIDDIVGEFIKYNLTSHLRNKYDQAKRNLRNVEEVLYDLSLRA
jgi:translin